MLSLDVGKTIIMFISNNGVILKGEEVPFRESGGNFGVYIDSRLG